MRVQAKFDSSRGYGVEIETAPSNVSRDVIAETLTRAGIPTSAEMYNHSTRSTWKVVADVSTGSEIVSPVLYGTDGYRQIKIVTTALKSLGLRVDRSTGLHVHHDASDITAKQYLSTMYLYAKAQYFTNALLPTRTDNRFAKQLDAASIKYYAKRFKILTTRSQITNANGPYDSDRYYTVNSRAFGRHGTIEFRQHSGSLNATKIFNWVVFTQSFINSSKQRATTTAPFRHYTVRSIIKALGSDANCPITKAARRDIVRRAVNNAPIIIGHDTRRVQQYMRPQSRRAQRAVAAAIIEGTTVPTVEGGEQPEIIGVLQNAIQRQTNTHRWVISLAANRFDYRDQMQLAEAAGFWQHVARSSDTQSGAAPYCWPTLHQYEVAALHHFAVNEMLDLVRRLDSMARDFGVGYGAIAQMTERQCEALFIAAIVDNLQWEIISDYRIPTHAVNEAHAQTLAMQNGLEVLGELNRILSN